MTPDLPTLRSLLSRVEEATGPDRRIDAEVARLRIEARRSIDQKATDIRKLKSDERQHSQSMEDQS